VTDTAALEPTLERVLFAQPPGWKLQPVVSWVAVEGRLISDPVRLIEGLIQVLRFAGAPVDRLLVGILTLHPQVGAWSLYWDINDNRVEYTLRERGVMISESYVGSPLQEVRDRGTVLRRRLHDIGTGDHATYHDLVTAGMTDYLAIPLTFSDGHRNVMSFATLAPGGFTDDDIAKLATLPLWLGPIFEAIEQRNVAVTLLNTYLGSRTGDQILRGLIKRGDGETIRAAIWMSDLRDFTAINEQLPPSEVLAILNSYFEFVAAAVTAHGGEILSFIGDAILVIFRVSDGDDVKAACNAALNSAVDAFDKLAMLNMRRQQSGHLPIRFGVGLHVGVVRHGNVGSLDRLSFTVVGPAVNRTARIESLTKEVGVPLLLSRELAALVDRPVESRGLFTMKGVGEPQEVFALVGGPHDPVNTNAANRQSAGAPV
jgi:adenylate cyclase